MNEWNGEWNCYNNNILIFFESGFDTRPALRRRRLRLVDLLVRIWLRFIFRRLILPVPVVENVFRAPLCDFIFGIVFTLIYDCAFAFSCSCLIFSTRAFAVLSGVKIMIMNRPSIFAG